jgi:hypothetical protein
MSNHKGEILNTATSIGGASVELGKDACTPKPALRKNVNTTSTNSKKQHNSKKVSTNTRLQSAASPKKIKPSRGRN